MNLLITGAWQQAKDYLPEIVKNHKVLFLQQEKDDLPCDPFWIEGIIGNGFFLSHPIEAFTNLRYIQLTSAGFDRVPMAYIKEKGIQIHNARGVYSIPMAEFAAAGVLALYKGLPTFVGSQRAHTWCKQRNLRELCGKTVVILGCGSVGTECALRFHSFGCYIVGVNRHVRKSTEYDAMVSFEELDSVLAAADIVVVTLPLTEETRGLLAARCFACMKRDAVFVNIARGALVEMEALLAWLENGGSAVLDVFENEPLEEESPLWEHERVIVTPHNSFIGDGNGKRLSRLILENLKHYG